MHKRAQRKIFCMKSPKGQFSERINRAYPRLTQGDRRIADHLLRTYPTGLLENASAIAQTLRLHVSTVCAETVSCP